MGELFCGYIVHGEWVALCIVMVKKFLQEFHWYVISSGRYLGFDHTATLFHIRDSPVDPVDRPIFLTNVFNFAIRIHNVSLPEEAKTMFNVSATRMGQQMSF